MRIAFLGKGGSGKSTLAAAFIKHVSSQKQILAIDADVNQHLAPLLEITPRKENLGDSVAFIQKYVLGKRNGLEASEVVGTLPPTMDSTFIVPKVGDPFIDKFAVTKDNISLMRVGTYEGKDIGSACYHSKLASLELFFHYLLDKRNEYIIVDSTAGTDILGTSLHMAYDVLVFVIEPTAKSVQVFKDFIERFDSTRVRVVALGNKVEDGDDKEFLRKNVGHEYLLGFVPYSKKVRRFEQGDEQAFTDFVASNNGLFSNVLEDIGYLKRDWAEYLIHLSKVHKKTCEKWYDEYYKKKISELVDSSFSYEKAMEINRNDN